MAWFLWDFIFPKNKQSGKFNRTQNERFFWNIIIRNTIEGLIVYLKRLYLLMHIKEFSPVKKTVNSGRFIFFAIHVFINYLIKFWKQW